jgi:hypothetical protein
MYTQFFTAKKYQTHAYVPFGSKGNTNYGHDPPKQTNTSAETFTVLT